MLVGFSCFCGFVCCKFQYIIPCPQPGSLSCFRHQVPQLRPLRRRGWCWDEFCTPAIPSHAPRIPPKPCCWDGFCTPAVPCHAPRIPPKPRCPALPGAGPPGAAVLTCAGRSAALWLEHPWAGWGRAGAAALTSGSSPSARGWLEGTEEPGWQRGWRGSGAVMSPRPRSGVQRGCGSQSARRGERGQPGRHSRNNWRELLINLIITLSCVNTLHMQKWLKSAN